MSHASETIVIRQTVEAPRERVYQAFLDPADLMRWHHADDGWTTPHARIDARPGGAFNIGFRSPDGAHDFDFEGAFDELNSPARIVYTIGDGRKVWIDLSETVSGTEVALTLTLETEHTADQQRHGWGLMLARLAEHLKV